jgi:hypothetical protein
MAILPLKTDSILLIDPNAALSLSVAFQQFQTISRRHSEFGKLPNPVELIQLAAGDRPD